MTLAQPAIAQRTEDNAAAQAEDAFGNSVGDSSIGIYNEVDVRGFSPTDAGNLRIEGLYYDQQSSLTERIQQSSTVRVGISAQSYPFPAPTGIADFALRKPGAESIVSVGLTFGPWGGKVAEVDAKLALDGNRLGLVAGAGLNFEGRSYGGTPNIVTAALLARYAPRSDMELIAFANQYRYTDGEAQPLIFSSGDFLPKRIPRGRFLGQSWNDYSASGPVYGFLGRGQIAGFEARLGLFRSVFDNDVTTADLLFDTDRDGSVGQRIIVRERDDRTASTSGEFRLSRSLTEGPRQHGLIASIRARDLRRRYGGGALVDFGASRSDTPDPRPEPVTIDGPQTRDHIRQATIGLAYQGKWLDVGEVTISLQKTDYQKKVTDPDPAIELPPTNSSPWLPAVTAAAYATRSIALYAGYTRGLEESAAAPIEAVNRNEAPPAIRTRQMDSGVRWTISPRVTAVAGLFRISKPYFNLDTAGRFRQLGTVTNKGVELSLAGLVLPGLTLVAGSVFLDATISGEEVDAGTIGRKPVGSFVRHSILSLDYRLPAYDRLSFDIFLDSSSKRTANALNTLTVPPRTTMTLGTRYRFKIADAPALLRVQVANVTNKFAWNVGRSGYFTPISGRSASVSLTADF
jgi:iron complex outermembrane receptor protein